MKLQTAFFTLIFSISAAATSEVERPGRSVGSSAVGESLTLQVMRDDKQVYLYLDEQYGEPVEIRPGTKQRKFRPVSKAQGALEAGEKLSLGGPGLSCQLGHEHPVTIVKFDADGKSPQARRAWRVDSKSRKIVEIENASEVQCYQEPN